MTAWQIFISVAGALYAAALLFVLYASIHDFRAADLAAPRSQFCPPGSTCRLCMTARESGADRIAAG